jgi:hypothetical protein
LTRVTSASSVEIVDGFRVPLRRSEEMIDRVGGFYPTPAPGVDRVGGRHVAPADAGPREATRSADLLARDSIRVASISDLAGRSSTYRMAIRSLDDIEGYLGDLI